MAEQPNPAPAGLFYNLDMYFSEQTGNTRRYLHGTAVKKGALNTPTVRLF